MSFQEFAESSRLGILATLPEYSLETPLPFSIVLLWVASEVWALLTFSSFGPTHSQTVPPSEQGGNGWLSGAALLFPAQFSLSSTRQEALLKGKPTHHSLPMLLNPSRVLSWPQRWIFVQRPLIRPLTARWPQPGRTWNVCP